MPIPSRTETTEKLLRFIEEQSAFRGRIAGSEAERNCQTALAGRLDRLGMEASVEGAVVPPLSQHILFVHGVAALFACVLALLKPGSAALLGGLVTLSFWGELRGRPRLLRGVLMKRLSGNMIARMRNDAARAALVLVAHADVASSSLHFRPLVKRFTIRREQPGRTIHPGSLVLLAGVVQVVASVHLWSRADLSSLAMGGLVGAALVQIGMLVLAIDWWRSPPVEGAIDNASGLAVAWGVAQSIVEEPLEHTELWLLATGDREPDCGGMRAFLHQSAHMFDPGSTFFMNIDDVGRGDLHYATAEGRWQKQSYRATLPGLAERLAKRSEFLDVRETTLVGTTDAGIATAQGFRAITLTSLVEGHRPGILHTHDDEFDAVDPQAVEKAHHFALELAREVDRFVGGVEEKDSRAP